MARYASRASSDYHTYQFFKDKQGNKERGTIVEIAETHISIMLIKYGLECKYQFSPEDAQKTVDRNKGKGVFNKCYILGKQKDLFGYVDVSVNVEMQGFHKKISINIL